MQILIKLWIVLLLSLNTLWIIVRAFVRNLKDLFGNDVLLFDYIHEYRYVTQSVIDLINGVSILFVLYNVIKSAKIRKQEARFE